MTEKWLPIPGYEGRYSASDLGRIRSEAHEVFVPKKNTTYRFKQRVCRPSPGLKGYLTATLAVHGQKVRYRKVHDLIALTFIGPRPTGLEILHRNGIQTDNRPSNLRYGTRSENTLDSVTHGTHRNSRKTKCKYGHDFTKENTATRVDKRTNRTIRRCRTCNVRLDLESKTRRGVSK